MIATMMMKMTTHPRPKRPSVEERIQPSRLKSPPPTGARPGDEYEGLDDPVEREPLDDELRELDDDELRELDPDRDPPLKELPPPGR
jgi:hypothetical protein